MSFDYLPFVAFRRRTNEEHRRLGDDYQRLGTPTARKNFVKEYATRYAELSRLPYFDLVSVAVAPTFTSCILRNKIGKNLTIIEEIAEA
jgi:hypothetical protein